MMTLRKADERGRFDFGWLDTRHTFSFGDYHNPRHMGFRSLRVINDDRVAAGHGFPMHPHRDMEIVTWILDGALEHKDSMGNGSVIRPGDIQRMTAGTGVTHSEFNPSKTEPVHLLQIWILPEHKGLTPGYEEKSFPREDRLGRLRLVASRDGREGSVTVHQDLSLYNAVLRPGEALVHNPAPGRHVWLQMARGSARLNDAPLDPGDGAALSEVRSVRIEGTTDAEVLLFDMA